jgi:4-amino-4-deoxy-L-arabinose transferase-like glycosyltransferase
LPGTLWLPIPALVCSGIPLLALFDPNGWDKDQLLGSFLFITAAVVLASISLAKQTRGKGMAIAALVMAAIALLGTCGTQL